MENILNYHQVNNRIASAGQPTPEQFSDIHEAGYTVVINLAMSDASNAEPEEETLIRSLGMTHVHIPVPFDNPTPAHVKAFFGVMDAFTNEKVFVHCALNLRASAFLYLYLTHVEGIQPEQVTFPMLEKWQPQMEECWRKILNVTSEEIGYNRQK